VAQEIPAQLISGQPVLQVQVEHPVLGSLVYPLVQVLAQVGTGQGLQSQVLHPALSSLKPLAQVLLQVVAVQPVLHSQNLQPLESVLYPVVHCKVQESIGVQGLGEGVGVGVTDTGSQLKHLVPVLSAFATHCSELVHSESIHGVVQEVLKEFLTVSFAPIG
jgi:hypothetical protein